MISYNIEANPEDIREAKSLFEFIGGNSADAVRIAINRAAPKIRTKASQAIRRQVRLKAQFINNPESGLKVVKATRAKLSGAIQTPSRGLLLTRYSTDPQISGDKVGWLRPPVIPPRGIKVKVKPTGSPETMSNKFFYIILPNSRALAIARRRSSAQIASARSRGTGGGSKGGSIDVAYAPSLSQVFSDVRDEVLPEAGQIYQSELLDAMRFLLQKQFPKE